MTLCWVIGNCMLQYWYFYSFLMFYWILLNLISNGNPLLDTQQIYFSSFVSLLSDTSLFQFIHSRFTSLHRTVWIKQHVWLFYVILYLYMANDKIVISMNKRETYMSFFLDLFFWIIKIILYLSLFDLFYGKSCDNYLYL